MISIIRFALFYSFLFLGTVSYSQLKYSFSVGFYHSTDFNIYRFFDNSFSGEDYTNKSSTGITDGVIAEWNFYKNFSFNTGLHFSSKEYFPDRLFSFGTVAQENITAIEVPLNIKGFIFSNKRKKRFYYYGMLGIVYHKELKRERFLINAVIDSQEVFTDDFFLPTATIGFGYNLGKGFTIMNEFAFRRGKCCSEYLNERWDKIGWAIMIVYKLSE